MEKERITELTIVYTHILVSTSFPGVMLPLSLLQQWVLLWQALSVQSPLPGGTPCSCWWFHLTCHPSYMFANMLSHLALTSLVSSSMLHPNLTHMVSFFMLDTICSLCHPRSAFLWLTMSEQFTALRSSVLASVPCHHSPAFGAFTPQHCCLTKPVFLHSNIIRAEISNCGGTIHRQNKGK